MACLRAGHQWLGAVNTCCREQHQPHALSSTCLPSKCRRRIASKHSGRGLAVCRSGPRWQREQAAARTSEQRQQDRDKKVELQKQLDKDTFIITATALGLTALATLGFTVFRDPIADWLLDASFLELGGNTAGLGIGDLIGGLAWSVALWFTSPLQLLFLFLGKIDIERPSDWLMRQIGAALGVDPNNPNWETEIPGWVRVVTAATCLVTGLSIAVVFNQALGDCTWSLSTGIGSGMAALIFEAGRPTRLSQEELVVLEGQWQDFAKFADQRLQRSGRCHESEIAAAFAKENARYRRDGALTSQVMRDMIRNWHPGAERTPKGFYKGVSVVQRVDPFTLEVSGSPRAQQAQQPQQPQQSQQQELPVPGQEQANGQGLAERPGSGPGQAQTEAQAAMEKTEAVVQATRNTS